jgi:Tol biopolymer transport system component
MADNYYKLTFKPVIVLVLFLAAILSGCSDRPGGDCENIEKVPAMQPDYSGITIPPNIAPLNFTIKEPGTAFYASVSSKTGDPLRISSSSGRLVFPAKKWKALLENNKGNELRIDLYSKENNGKWKRFKSITNTISADPIDPYLYYRLLYPGYESWSELSIECRSTESFKSHSLIRNTAADENCVNCHSFNNGRTDDFMFHMRGSHGGTYFYSEGKFRKVNPKTDEISNGAVYPRWHPSGKFVAFSSNKIRQRFHSADNKKVEVSDLESSLVLYDVEKNEIMKIGKDTAGKYMDTFPEWSPDGKYLYFCRAPQIGEEYDYREIRYSLYRFSFDSETRTAGEAELVFNADSMKKSISFPRISPDGKFLIATLADYGCFPVWHKEADLWSIDLSNGNISKLDLNSDLFDSYHSWSSNGRWIVFSSKRDDGLTARPYIAWIDADGKTGKPFILPQKDPDFYGNFLKTFNIPEFSNMDIKLNPGETRRLVNSKAIQAKWSGGK